MPIDAGRIEAAVAELLAAIGEDPARPGLASTPRRFAEAYAGFFAGVGQDPLEHLADQQDLDGETGELVVLRDIEFRSMCEHHLLPFLGRAHVAYAPDRRIVGLGKLPRVVETLASRPQLQERLTTRSRMHSSPASRRRACSWWWMLCTAACLRAVHGRCRARP